MAEKERVFRRINHDRSGGKGIEKLLGLEKIMEIEQRLGKHGKGNEGRGWMWAALGKAGAHKERSRVGGRRGN